MSSSSPSPVHRPTVLNREWLFVATMHEAVLLLLLLRLQLLLLLLLLQ